jgi:hypothetical protein
LLRRRLPGADGVQWQALPTCGAAVLGLNLHRTDASARRHVQRPVQRADGQPVSGAAAFLARRGWLLDRAPLLGVRHRACKGALRPRQPWRRA